ncbi:MAG: sirohydrochlorin cobaltochelatase [Lachnospiraceae bacterium]|nr:sirohydrochlorin cobaltochelatase [Lachnospiraceae bacterium]
MEKGLLVISFGTSYQDTCEKTIAALEKDLTAAFPDRVFYRAWTSGFIRKKLKERDGVTILSPEEAFEKMKEDGVKDVLVQPTHMLAGGEFEKVTAALKPCMDAFEKAVIGKPLMENEEDIRLFVEKLAEITEGIKEDEMAVFMGHGSSETKIPVYDLINRFCEESGHKNIVVGTVEFEPGIAPVLEKVKAQKPKKVYLAPLLVVAGDHANNDMAGDDEDSWKNQIAKEGPEVECIIKGLGEYKEIRALYVQHAKEA